MRICFISYDSGDHVPIFPANLAYLTAVLEKAGHEVVIYDQDIKKSPDEKITEFLLKEYFDFVGVGMCGGYYQYQRAQSISRAIRGVGEYLIYMMGGHLVTPDPAFFMKKMMCDVIFLGEAEETIVDFMNRGTMPKTGEELPGIAYHLNNREIIKINKRRPLIQNLDDLPFPAYHKFNMDVYTRVGAPHRTNADRVAYVLSARGCKFQCNFCYRMDEGYRERSPDNVMEEIKMLQKDYGITHINFNEELFMGSEQRVINMCKAIEKHKLEFKWSCDGRLNFAKPHILKMMKEAGCVFINYGIEAWDNQVMKNMGKALTVEIAEQGVKDTLAQGISPGLNIIFGNYGDTAETLEKGVNFLLKYSDGSQFRTIRPVTFYPGTPGFERMVKEGKIKDVEDFYENKHTNSDLVATNATNLSDDEVHELLRKANRILAEDYYKKIKDNVLAKIDHLYNTKDCSFHGFRGT